mgnify:CR=1 FL=1
MSESILKSILEESAILEWAKYDNVPEHTFSKKHNRKMSHIFRLYEKNTRQYRSYAPTSHFRFRLTRKTAVILALIIFVAVTGCAAAYFWSKNFRGEVHCDNTALFVINTENCPEFIEEKYYLPEVPEGFEMSDAWSNPFEIYTCYWNESTKQEIVFSQTTKPNSDPIHINTEKFTMEEIDLNGYPGVYVDYSTNGNASSMIIWDNGDYILQLSADFDKETTSNLAKSAKVLKN